MMLRLYVAPFLAFLLARSATSEYQRLDLGDLTWTLSNEPNEISVSGTVPGGVFTDLHQAGVLDETDFYYRFNDDEFRWVAWENWTYSAQFSLDSSFLQGGHMVILDCLGMDTVSSIWLNGRLIGGTDNMFVRYSFDVAEFLFPGSNQIEIQFQSPLEYSQKMFDLQAESYIVPPECVDPQFQGECHANHIRKMQASFSWDWGPAFPSMGVWKPLYLESFQEAVLRHVKWTTVKDDSSGDWTCHLDLVFEKDPLVTLVTGDVEVEIDGLMDAEVFPVTLEEPEGGYFGSDPAEAAARVTLEFSASDVELWWPNEYGDQTLYQLSVSFTPYGGDASTVEQRVAFRTVELVQDPLEEGLTFMFRVNGLDIFMKGTNWIPAHVLPELVTPEYTHGLLHSARESHMNMIRVWGGGIYESDAFYDSCDELGILVWQDHMFACSMYQANQENLESADRESRTQIRRLQHHASIALWAGNNENEAALADNWYGTDSDYAQYSADYLALYVDVIMARVEAEDPNRPFLVSSPTNGDETISEGYLASNPYSTIYGDIHYYNYVEDNWDSSIYLTTRFASEYGFQSYPSFEILSGFSEPEDWSFYSEFTNHRQRHPNGNEELPNQIDMKMDLPSEEELGTEEGYKEFLYQAQIYQAVSLKTETESYRRQMFRIMDEDAGEGFCAGALYWQLNDIWPGASWASLEYGGTWKPSHYMGELAFRAVLVSPVVSEGSMEVTVASDLTQPMEDLTLVISVKRWTGFDDAFVEEVDIDSFPSQSSAVVHTESMETLLQNGGCDGEDGEVDEGYCFIHVRLVDSDTTVASNTWMPYPKFSLGLSVPNITVIDVNEDKEFDFDDDFYVNSFSIDISTDAVAPYTWITAEGLSGRFDQNAFLFDTPTTTVHFLTPDSLVSADDVKDAVRVRSYKNSHLLDSETATLVEIATAGGNADFHSRLRTTRTNMDKP